MYLFRKKKKKGQNTSALKKNELKNTQYLLKA